MDIQRQSKNLWESNARCSFKQQFTGQRDGAMVEAQTCEIPGDVGQMRTLLQGLSLVGSSRILLAKCGCKCFWNDLSILVWQLPFGLRGVVGKKSFQNIIFLCPFSSHSYVQFSSLYSVIHFVQQAFLSKELFLVFASFIILPECQRNHQHIFQGGCIISSDDQIVNNIIPSSFLSQNSKQANPSSKFQQ